VKRAIQNHLKVLFWKVWQLAFVQKWDSSLLLFWVSNLNLKLRTSFGAPTSQRGLNTPLLSESYLARSAFTCGWLKETGPDYFIKVFCSSTLPPGTYPKLHRLQRVVGAEKQHPWPRNTIYFSPTSANKPCRTPILPVPGGCPCLLIFFPEGFLFLTFKLFDLWHSVCCLGGCQL